MIKRYFTVGLRPIIAEESKDRVFVYSFNWNTGLFDVDFNYYPRVYFGPRMDETEELTKEEFDRYLENLRREKGFSTQ